MSRLVNTYYETGSSLWLILVISYCETDAEPNAFRKIPAPKLSCHSRVPCGEAGVVVIHRSVLLCMDSRAAGGDGFVQHICVFCMTTSTLLFHLKADLKKGVDMDVENLHLKVNAAELQNQARFEELAQQIATLDNGISERLQAVEVVAPSEPEEVQGPILIDTQKEIQMDAVPHVKNIFESAPAGGMGGAIGGGLGAGLLGGVLGGALLGGNGGLLGGRNGNVEGLVTPTLLNSSIAQVQDTAVATTTANAFREIQAAIECTAAATQLAQQVSASALGVEIAKGQGEINTQVALTTGNLGTQNALNASATQVLVQKTVGDLATQTALGDARTQEAIAAVGTANALGFKDVAIQTAATQYAIAQAVQADGDKTRALITSYEQAELNRKIVIQANELTELRNDGRGRDRAKETEVSVTQIVNQNQQQQQQQQQFLVLSNLNSALQALVQQNQTIHQGIVNLGTMSGSAGQQSSANTKVQ